MDEVFTSETVELSESLNEDILQLKTVSEYCKTLSEDIQDFNVLDRFGELIERCNRTHLLKHYSRRRVFNFYDREPGLQDLYISVPKV